MLPASNSTRKSTSLSSRKSSRNAEPNNRSSRIPWRRQNAAIRSRGILMRGLLISRGDGFGAGGELAGGEGVPDNGGVGA